MTTLNILIVDNDAGSRRLIRLALLAQSYECMAYEADSAKAAIGTLAQHGESVDVMLLDGHLGGQTATFVIDHVRSDERLENMRIVVLTGSLNQIEHDQYIAHGADAVMEIRGDINALISGLASLTRYNNAK